MIKKWCIRSILLWFSVANAAQYYVSPTGNDGAEGSISSPWATPQYAAQQPLLPGDIIWFREGVYDASNSITPQASGTLDNPIQYRSFPNETACFRGAKIPDLAGKPVPWHGLFHLVGRDHILLTGLQLEDAHGVGVLVDHCNYINIESTTISNTYSSAIAFYNCNYIGVFDNELSYACDGGWGEWISLHRSQAFNISRNDLHDHGNNIQGGEGIDVQEYSAHGLIQNNRFSNLKNVAIYIDSRGLTLDESTIPTDVAGTNKLDKLYDIQILDNFITESQSGIVVTSEENVPLSDITIHNNICAFNGGAGISLKDHHDGTDTVNALKSNISIENNTSWCNGHDYPWWGLGGIGVNVMNYENVTIRNNISGLNDSYQIIVPNDQNVICEYNLIFTDGRWNGYETSVFGTLCCAVSAEDQTPFIPDADALFADEDSFDFSLSTNSPALGTGSLDNLNGPNGRNDIGANLLLASLEAQTLGVMAIEVSSLETDKTTLRRDDLTAKTQSPYSSLYPLVHLQQFFEHGLSAFETRGGVSTYDYIRAAELLNFNEGSREEILKLIWADAERVWRP